MRGYENIMFCKRACFVCRKPITKMEQRIVCSRCREVMHIPCKDKHNCKGNKK